MTEITAFPFDNTYSRLPDRFFTRQTPVKVKQPGQLVTNMALAKELGIAPKWLESKQATQIFAGNLIPKGAAPLAQVYAGHQFGGWNPQLGDGRAILLGEFIDPQGGRRDIQLKGAGRTPYSRGGDGRAWLGPVLREYVVSEAMHAYGVPTTRALAAVSTGEMVQRERALPGAVLTRVAASHIRVGTFQYFAARQDHEALQILCDHVIERHYPDATGPLDLLNSVVARQAGLIAKWMSVGFIHGVMNTDNMAISGETIDYGPCAFMDDYHPGTVFSSIDRMHRYAFDKQPEIAAWNLAQFASCLLPLLGEEKQAVETATGAVRGFSAIFQQQWETIFLRKIGLQHRGPDDVALVVAFLQGLAATETDFTNGFRDLLQQKVPAEMATWKSQWLARLKQESGDTSAVLATANPAYIPRNHRIEAMISAALAGDYSLLHRLNSILAQPFDAQPDNREYRSPPMPQEVVQHTFCGT